MIANALLETIELRRYRMKPGRRDDLISLFEDEFIESQEACGMLPVGHFRDLDDDDAFVWLRGFPRFEERAKALEAFYLRCESWLKHRDAANDTLIDSDNVLLLRPAREESGFHLLGAARPSSSSREESPRFVWLCETMLELPVTEAVVRSFEDHALPLLPGTSYFVTEQRRNEFPRHPVRETEYAFVACALCDTLDDLERRKRIVSERFIPKLGESVLNVEHRRLRPARRSLLR